MESTEKLIAIDPGERVGWATGVIGPADPMRSSVTHDIKVTNQGVTPLKDFALKLFEVAGDYNTIVYETWRLYPAAAKVMIGNDMQPSQLVGMIRMTGWLNPKVKLVSQGANIKNTALKTMPEHIQARFELSSEQHDQDALMHLWHYFWSRHIANGSN